MTEFWPSESLAKSFDGGFDAPGNKSLRLDAEYNVGGGDVSIRYYLGMLNGRNLFRAKSAEVAKALALHLQRYASKTGSRIAFSPAGPNVVVALLRHDFHLKFEPDLASDTRPLACLRYLLKHPNASIAEIAEEGNTTPKQVLRQTNTAYAMRLLREVGARTCEKSKDRI